MKTTAIIFACMLTSITQTAYCESFWFVKPTATVQYEPEITDTCYEPEITDTCCPCTKQHPLIEVKAGYFFFTDSVMRHVYDEGGLDVQLSGSYPFYKLLHVYGSVEYLEKSGHSINGHQKTSLWAIPLSLGLRPVFPIGDHLQVYFTIGPRYFFVHAHNHSSYVPKKMHANGCGGFVNTGVLFIIGKHFTIDLFGEYSYKRLHFHSGKPETEGHTVQVGGLTFGGGLGYSF